MKQIYYCIICWILLGCGHYNNLDYSNDFYLIYENDVDKIDLKDNTFTRRFIDEDSTISLRVTDSEKKQLFKLMKDYAIWTVDKADLRTPCQSMRVPSGHVTLEISLEKGNKFEFSWTGNNCHKSIDKLREVSAKIREIIYAKKEVKNLAESNLVFM